MLAETYDRDMSFIENLHSNQNSIVARISYLPHRGHFTGVCTGHVLMMPRFAISSV